MQDELNRQLNGNQFLTPTFVPLLANYPVYSSSQSLEGLTFIEKLAPVLQFLPLHNCVSFNHFSVTSGSLSLFKFEIF